MGGPRLQAVGLSVKALSELAAYHFEVISSLSLVCTGAVAPEILDTRTSRLVVFNGDQGSAAAALQRSMIVCRMLLK